MSKWKIELNRSGMREMLKSEPVREALQEKADTIANRAGDGYEAESSIGRERALANVHAETYKALLDNSRHNTLLKAVNNS